MERSESAESPRAARHRRPRLSKSADFDRVYRKGRSVASRHLVLYAFPRGTDVAPAGTDGAPSKEEAQGAAEGAEGAADVRLGVSVGRKVGGAVDRNRVKRCIREAFWSLLDDLPGAHDYVVVARPSSTGLLEGEGMTGLRGDLSDLVARFGAGATDEPEGPRGA